VWGRGLCGGTAVAVGHSAPPCEPAQPSAGRPTPPQTPRALRARPRSRRSSTTRVSPTSTSRGPATTAWCAERGALRPHADQALACARLVGRRARAGTARAVVLDRARRLWPCSPRPGPLHSRPNVAPTGRGPPPARAGPPPPLATSPLLPRLAAPRRAEACRNPPSRPPFRAPAGRLHGGARHRTRRAPYHKLHRPLPGRRRAAAPPALVVRVRVRLPAVRRAAVGRRRVTAGGAPTGPALP
jgi:hypothetical protein